MIWKRSEIGTKYNQNHFEAQVLLGEEEWSELPGSSQIFYDARAKLISTYQYHQDFYFGDEGFLKVSFLLLLYWRSLEATVD